MPLRMSANPCPTGTHAWGESRWPPVEYAKLGRQWRCQMVACTRCGHEGFRMLTGSRVVYTCEQPE